MRRFADFFRIVTSLLVLLFLASNAAHAQSSERKKLIEEYLRKRSGSDVVTPSDSFSSVRDMYEPMKVEVPPVDSAGEEMGKGKSLRRFGFDLFAHPPESFVASTETPVPPDYVLGPGDHIIVNLWGHTDLSYELVIDREGKVFIPKAGELVLWGLGIDQAEERIANLLGTIYSDFRINVILGKIRSITVYVSGEVKRPGAYTVSSLYTLFNTLYLSGGPGEKGSMRDIRLIRHGKVFKRVDLYRMLLEGEGDDVRLESNDIIFVPVVGPLVRIDGEVTRPGIYELKGGERILDLISMAGGFRSSSYLGGVELYRYDSNRRRILLTLDLSDSASVAVDNVRLRDGDEVFIRKVHKVADNIVYLDGAVKYPGEYQYREGMRVTDLVDREILLPHAYLKRAFLTRTFADNSRKVYPLDLAAILGIEVDDPPQDASPGIYEPVDTTVLVKDIELRPWDRLEIFPVDRMRDQFSVRIQGEVRKPGRYEYAREMTLSDLVYLAGGLKKSAYLLNVEIGRMNEDTTMASEVIRVNLLDALRFPHSEKDPVLEPQDMVFVREMPNYRGHETVWIGGEVVFPGSYVLESDSESLKHLIVRAGGFTDRAFLEGAIFMRKGVAEDLERRNVLDVVTSLQQSYTDSLGILKERFVPMDINPSKMNRIIIDLPSIMSSDDDGGDIILRDGDRIFIPRKPSGVSVIGAVASSGTIKFVEGKSARYYIDRAGGFMKMSAKGEVRVIKANGRVVRRRALSHTIELGDVIVVPRKVEKERDWLRIFQSTMSMLASALTAVYLVTKL